MNNESLNDMEKFSNICTFLREKNTNLKRWHTVWLQLCHVLVKAKLERQQKGQWLPKVRHDGGINWHNKEKFYGSEIVGIIF